MIQKFRWRFISLSIISLFVILFVSIGSLVAINFYRDSREVNRVLSTLVENNGNLTLQNSRALYKNKQNIILGPSNPESIFQYRYFTVLVDKNNKKVLVNKPRDFQSNKQHINEKVDQILNRRKMEKGIIRLDRNNYAYQIFTDQFGQKNIVFLNTTLIYAHSWTLLRLAVLLGFTALIIFAIILIIASGLAIRPIAEAYHKQQQFITNAGHELKTPLAIISANTEMEEMLGNESEWTKSTKEQTQRLTELINHLIALARMSETGEIALSKVNLSKIVESASRSFSSVMKQKDLTFKTKIQKDIFVSAEEKTLTELVNIFLDNAQKYCDPHGEVSIDLHKNKWNNNASLIISNTYAEGKNIDYSKFFDRFYREDESHNNKKAGFGIGLSMARDLVHTFKGKIKVEYHEDMISFIISLKTLK